MKLHEVWRPTMEPAAQSLYRKVSACSFNSECGKRMLIVPTDDEITLLHWLLREFAEQNDIEL